MWEIRRRKFLPVSLRLTIHFETGRIVYARTNMFVDCGLPSQSLKEIPIEKEAHATFQAFQLPN